MTTTTVSPKPTPEPDDQSREFFDGAQRNELMLKRCDACQAWLLPGAVSCTECLGEDLSWQKASGRGTVHTFGVMHQLYHQGFRDLTPYNVAIVELVEGPRMQTNLVEIDNDQIHVGMGVEVRFPEHTPGFRLPKFAPGEG